MAVTQHLARIRTERARRASTDEDALESIISYEEDADDGFEDFNWFPRLLEGALTVLDREDLADVVSDAFECEEVLNPRLPRQANGYFVDSEIRVSWTTTVARLARALIALPVSDLSGTRDLVAAKYPDYELPERYPEEIAKYAKMLIAFYSEAASRNQVIVSWWD